MNIEAVCDPKAVVYTTSGDTGTPSSGYLAVVVAHGFTGDAGRPHVRRMTEVLARYGSVVTFSFSPFLFSFRGHGRSGGHSTVGGREVLDLAAVVRWARELGHERVATVGFRGHHPRP